MRIVGGSYRGRRLAVPEGASVRPTAERVREALFDILAHGVGVMLADSHVVDAFAGTGALGFEALSRGAAAVTFMETDRAARQAIRSAAAALDAADRVRVVTADASRPPSAEAACALAFIDPPYGSDLAAPALAALAAAGWLADGAVAVVELGARETLDPPDGFTVVDERRYGTTRLVFLGYATQPEPIAGNNHPNPRP